MMRYSFAAVQQVPWIMLNAVEMHPFMEYLIDEMRTMAVLPLMITDFPIPMNFYQRLVNSAIIYLLYAESWLIYPGVKASYDSYFGPLAVARGVPHTPFLDAILNISILFVNSHPSVAPAQSLPPNVVEVAGYHIEDNIEPLPEDLQKLLDTSSSGVVYFSMGSVLKSADFPEHTKKELMQILGELPYTVLWKFEDQLEGLPSNVHIRPWMPQTSILAHPKVKVFITHGGLLSTLEAVHFGVPLLAVPVYGDQPINAERAQRAGYARCVPYAADMGPQLRVALQDMLRNDSYQKQVRILSKTFHARPVAPSKLISHYVELAIETKGAHHLRSKARLYPWYQRWMVDQLAALSAAVYFVYLLARKVCRVVCTSKNKDKVVEKKKVKKH